MKNCLVTRLKGVVNNPNLDYFDSILVKIDWELNTGPAVVIRNTSAINIGAVGCTVKIISNGYIAANSSDTNHLSEYTIPSTSETKQIFPVNSSANTEFIVIGLSKIEHLHFNRTAGIWVKNLGSLNFCENIQPDFSTINTKKYLAMYYPYPSNEVDMSNYVKNVNNKGQIESIMWYKPSSDSSKYGNFFVNASAIEGYSSLTTLNRTFRILGGNASSFESLTAIQTLGIGVNGRSSEGVTGNISSFGKLKNLTSLNINDTLITGSVEELVAAFRAASSTGAGDERTSGSVTVWFGNSTYITYKGEKIIPQGTDIVWTASEIWVEGIDPEPRPTV